MARYSSKHVRPPKAVKPLPSPPPLLAQKTASPYTLDELQRLATPTVCTKAQLLQAVETVGKDPDRVATYLRRYGFNH